MEKEFLADPKVRLYRSGDHLSDWLTAIRSREQPICDVEIGASTANLCNLVNLAYYHGQPMKWDPARERFAGGTGDESWLDVPHREPWKVGFRTSSKRARSGVFRVERVATTGLVALVAMPLLTELVSRENRVCYRHGAPDGTCA